MSSDGPAGIGLESGAEESTVGADGGRRLKAGEIAFLRTVFQDAVDYGLMRVKKGSLLTIAAGGVTIDNVVNINPDWYFEDFSTAPLDGQALLAHETTHVWQYQRGIRGYRWLKAAWEHVRYGKATYDYVLDKNKALTDYRFEQMGQIVQDYFRLAPDAPERALYEAVIARSIPRSA